MFLWELEKNERIIWEQYSRGRLFMHVSTDSNYITGYQLPFAGSFASKPSVVGTNLIFSFFCLGLILYILYLFVSIFLYPIPGFSLRHSSLSPNCIFYQQNHKYLAIQLLQDVLHFMFRSENYSIFRCTVYAISKCEGLNIAPFQDCKKTINSVIKIHIIKIA